MSSGSFESTSRPLVKCRCGIPAALKTSMTVANTGRRFLACKFYNPETSMRGCNFFKWVDEPMNEMTLLKSEIALQKRLEEMNMQIMKNENKCNELVLEIAHLKENEKRFYCLFKVAFIFVIFLIYKVVM
ncbi:uncharacterized protein LOC141595372 [Silene latifolia]|uniref:uncharacterized protein LOC141595372 n=1 Tax=Silene latifolia TaxID=37657 RepID=UPI003D773626